MKKITYRVMREFDAGTENNQKVAPFFEEFYAVATEDELPIALKTIERIAYNGEYTIEDDGQPEPEPTEQEQLRADVDFLLAMGGVL